MSKPSYFRPSIFDVFPEVVAVHSLRDAEQAGNFSMLAAGATEEIGAANRERLAKELGVDPARIAAPREVHGDHIISLDSDYRFDARPEGDALITNMPGWLIGATVADCVAVLLYDPKHRAVGAVHSGRRGSLLNIAGKTVAAIQQTYATDPAELIAYLSPAPSRFEYNVSHEVGLEYDPRYTSGRGDGWYLDNKQLVLDQLLGAGLKPGHIQVDPRSSIADPHFHSYRRDGEQAGRMLVAIGLRA